MSQSLIWLVTATTSGLGASLVEQIVARGDRVIATGRNAEQRLGHLKSDRVAVLDLDVTANTSEIAAKVETAWEIFGKIDVIVNNAGVSSPCSIEEASHKYVQDIFNVNVFGNLRVTQAILPHFRAQRSGTVAFTGAGMAWAPLPFLSHYAASKAALDIFVEGLAQEVGSLGIRAIMFEPGGFDSNLGQPREGSELGFGKFKPSIADYDPLFSELMNLFATDLGVNIVGDVSKIARNIVDVIKGEGLAHGRKMPVRVILGSDALAVVRQKCQQQLDLAKEWESTTFGSDKDSKPRVSESSLKIMSITSDR